jgi:hypothetical protein
MILVGHPADQRAQFLRNRRAARSGLDPPQQSPAGAVPADHGGRLDDHQGAAPIEQSGEQRQADAGSGIDAPRPDTALDVQRQLTAQEEVLRLNRLVRTEQQRHPPEGIREQAGGDLQDGDHAHMVPHGSGWGQLRSEDGIFADYTRHERQSHHLDHHARLTRVEASMRRGFTSRSL